MWVCVLECACMMWWRRSLFHRPVYADQAGPQLHVVLDLDGTLIHSEDEESFVQLLNTLSPEQRAKFRMPDGRTESYVTWLRPHVKLFLEQVSQMATLHVFTAASRSYANGVIKLLDPEHKYFCKGQILCNDSTSAEENWVKDISLLQVPLEHVVLVDDLPRSTRWHPHNGILVPAFMMTRVSDEDWQDAQEDTVLLDVLVILHVLKAALEADIPVYTVLEDLGVGHAPQGSRVSRSRWRSLFDPHTPHSSTPQ